MNSDKNKTISRKGKRGKMTPQTSSIQPQSQNIFSTKFVVLMGSAKQQKYIYVFLDHPALS